MADIRVIDNAIEPVGGVISAALQTADVGRIATAFMKRSGFGIVASAVEGVLAGGGEIYLVYGLDFHITDPGVIADLVDLANGYARLSHTAYSDWGLATAQTFHPKLYIATREDGEATVVVGSSNLTAGGLRSNVEANTVIVGRVADRPIAEAIRVFTRIQKTPDLFVPSEAYLERYRSLYHRARRTSAATRPPRELAAAYRELKRHEQRLPGPSPTQKRLIIDAIKELRAGSDEYVHLREITAAAERLARRAGADFDWRTFRNSVRGRLNEHTLGKGGDSLFERYGGVEGRQGRYRLTDAGEAYQSR